MMLVFSAGCSAIRCHAQGYRGLLPAEIGSTYTLMPGTYQVSGRVHVAESGNLLASNNVTLLFDSAAVIDIEGAASFAGTPDGYITIKSLTPEKPGLGMRVRGFQSASFMAHWVRFYHLVQPIRFDFNWYRTSVDISNCIFKFCGRNTTVLEFRRLDALRAPGSCNVTITGNTFSNNSGGVVITDIPSTNVVYKLQNNVITRNEQVGGIDNGMFSAPLYLSYDAGKGGVASTMVRNNSIFDNFNYTSQAENAPASVNNMYLLGGQHPLDLGSNYFGMSDKEKIASTIEMAANGSGKSNGILLDGVPATPLAEANAYFYEVLVNDQRFTGTEPGIGGFFPFRTVQLKLSRPVYPGPDFSVKYYYYQEDKIYSVQVPVQPEFDNKHLQMNLSFGDFFEKITPNGYLLVDGAYDNDHHDLPALIIGKREFAIRNRIDYNNVNSFSNEEHDDSLAEKRSDSLRRVLDSLNRIKKDTVKEDAAHHLHAFSVSVFGGAAVYQGDLTKSGLGYSPGAWRPAFGVWLGYDLTERLYLQARLGYMQVTGADSSKSNSSGYATVRGLSFRTTIIELGLLAGYRLLDSRDQVVGVNLHAGISGFNFKPMGKYNGKWYDLRSIGSAGQTLDGKHDTYGKLSFGVPFGLSIERRIRDRWNIGLDLTVCRTFTDYLDDVAGGDQFPDPARLAAANPSLANISVALTNPHLQTGPRSYTATSKKDWYGYAGLTISMKLGKLKK
jgi:hypothetical protein